MTVSLAECNTTLLAYNQGTNQSNMQNGVSETQYCARDSDANGKTDDCNDISDTGGPLQIISSDSNLAKIVGVASYGISCGKEYPNVYTRVASYLDWIEENVWPDKQISTNARHSE